MSKAFLRSTNTTPTSSLSSSVEYQSSVSFRSEDTVEWTVLNPDGLSDKGLILLRYLHNLSNARFSKSFESIDKTEIGLWLNLSVVSPSLNIGVTGAIFHASGNFPFIIETLNIVARESQICRLC